MSLTQKGPYARRAIVLTTQVVIIIHQDIQNIAAYVHQPRSARAMGLGSVRGSGLSAAATESANSFAAANSRIFLIRLLLAG
jgi:hypothetical protein